MVTGRWCKVVLLLSGSQKHSLPLYSMSNLLPLLVTDPSADLHWAATRCLLPLHLFNYSVSVQPGISPGRQYLLPSTPRAAVSWALTESQTFNCSSDTINEDAHMTPCFRMAFGVWLMSNLGIISLLTAHCDSLGFVQITFFFFLLYGRYNPGMALWATLNSQQFPRSRLQSKKVQPAHSPHTSQTSAVYEILYCT